MSQNTETHESKRDLTQGELLDLLFQYSAKIAAEWELDRLLVLMADLGRQMVVADRCSLWLLDEKENQLWTKVAHGVPEIRMPFDKGLVGYAIKTGESIVIDDAYADSRFNSQVDSETGYRTKSILVIPMKNNSGKVIGAFQALNKMTSEAKFTDRDQEHLVMTAVYSGKSIESAMLYRVLEETQRESIFLLGEVGEWRSPETGLHTKRVAEYCRTMGELIGLSPEQVEEVQMASPLHDLGKVAIPDQILNKPGKLTDDEFTLMKEHARYGAELLNKTAKPNAPLLQSAAVIAMTHHEKYNGRGYPQGLKGEDIPLYGRIVAIADVFDALANPRCYKPAWERERIIKLFEEEKGEHFDPEFAQLFLDNADEFFAINEKYADEGVH